MSISILDDFADVLEHTQEMIGKPGGTIFVDVGVIKHDIFSDNAEEEHKDLIPVGTKGTLITLKDIVDVFRKASNLPHSEDRSYFWEGMRKQNSCYYMILWGS